MLASARPISCNQVIQGLEADEFIFIEVGSASKRLAKIAGRIPEAVKEFSIVGNESGGSPGTRSPTLPCGIETIVDFKRGRLPINNLHDPALRRADRIEFSVRKGQRSRVALQGNGDRALILTDRREPKDVSRAGIDRIDPTGRSGRGDLNWSA